VRAIEMLMPLVGGLNNNVKIYGDALSFSSPKASKRCPYLQRSSKKNGAREPWIGKT